MSDPGKSKRPDRTQKLKERRLLEETVVKCCLNKLLVLGKDYKKTFEIHVRKRVKECSIKTVNASVALNLLVRKIVDGVDNDHLYQVTFPDFWDVTFVRQLMLGTQGSVKPFSIIEKLYQDHPNLLDTSRSFGDRNIYSSAAIKFATNIKNHLKVNFEKTWKKALYKGRRLNSLEGFLVQKDVYGWKGKPKVDSTVQVDTQKVQDAIKYYRQLFNLSEGDTIGKLWFKKEENIPNMLKLFIHTVRLLEDAEEKLINILPICKIKSHFITVDSFTMVSILKDIGFFREKDTWDDCFWEKVLNISKIQGKGKKFTGTIDTDGFAINVHFHRLKHQECSSQEVCLIGKRVLGVDPGRSNILTVVEETSPDVFKSFTLTRNHYYNASGIFQARTKSNRWNYGIKSELHHLSLFSPKSVRLSTFLDYLDVFLDVNNKLWDEYTKPRWQQQRFRLYGGKKRVFAKFLNRLGSPENTVLAFGNAKFEPGGKGELSVPTSRAFKECSYRFTTVPIDEFRTTKINWKTHDVLDTVVQRQNDKLVAVRGLLWCRSTNQTEGKFVDRDINAAINIQRCAVLPSRPMIFQRSKAIGKLEQRIGKIIRC